MKCITGGNIKEYYIYKRWEYDIYNGWEYKRISLYTKAGNMKYTTGGSSLYLNQVVHGLESDLEYTRHCEKWSQLNQHIIKKTNISGSV